MTNQTYTNHPTTHQGLFSWAIRQRSRVNAEWGTRKEAWELWAWARWYAQKNTLVCPTLPEDFGIYYAPLEEEEAELASLGLLPENWEAIKSNEEMWW